MRKILTLIDVQEKLVPLMENSAQFVDNLVILLKGAQLLDLPIIWMEQLPDKLGSTIPEVKDLMKGHSPIIKNVFSCGDSDAYLSVLSTYNPDEVVLCGIETHVCVYQTAVDLLSMRKSIQVVADAVTSRNKLNHDVGLQRISDKGGSLTTYELLLFEEQRVAEGERFRALIQLIK